jgi:hypothetical protein
VVEKDRSIALRDGTQILTIEDCELETDLCEEMFEHDWEGDCANSGSGSGDTDNESSFPFEVGTED